MEAREREECMWFGLVAYVHEGKPLMATFYYKLCVLQ